MLKMLVILFFILLSGCLVNTETSEDLPIWKKILKQYQRWEGSYNHNIDVHRCSLYIHSIQKSTDGGMFATFRDENTVMEVDGFTSQSGDIIDIRKVTTFNSSAIFPKEDSFRARLKLRYAQTRWVLSGNITEPVDKGFSILYLDAINLHDKVEVSDDGKDGMRIGLSVGIPVALAVILSIVAVSMIIWAVKKGYLRHTPRNYKQFDNSKLVTFHNTEEPNPSVHI